MTTTSPERSPTPSANDSRGREASGRPSTWRSRFDRPLIRLGGFALALVLALVVGGSVGAVAAPTPALAPASPAGTPGSTMAQPLPAGGTPGAAADVSGLAVSQDGYTLDVTAAPAPAGSPSELAFRILGPGGAPVTTFTPTHDRPLHLIVVRRDQSGFQHLHPVMGPDGTWRTTTSLVPGDHRVFADFAPDGRSESMTLGRDIAVAGAYNPIPLPPPSTIATTPDGYTVTLTGALVPGTASPVTLSVSRDGVPVTDLQPYLAAYGHLVALRAGDLAYLHVHPTGTPGDGRTAAGPAIEFMAEVPSAGPYRLYLDFAHQGVVRTAEFTLVAAADPGTPTSAPSDHDQSSAPHGH